MTNQFGVVHTPCKNCVFAQYSNTMVKPTQLGCRVGRLDLLKKTYGNDVIVEAEDADRAFSVVANHVCSCFRDENGAFARIWNHEQQAEQVRKEIQVRVDAVVVESDCGHVTPTIQSLVAQTLKPRHIFVVMTNASANPAHCLEMLGKAAGDVPFSLTFMLDKKLPGYDDNQFGACVDEVFPKMKSHFYVMMPSGYELPPTALAELDQAINDRLDQFFVLDHEFCKFVHVKLHNTYDGNRFGEAEEEDGKRVQLRSIVEKAAYFAPANDCPHLYRQASEVLPCLSR